MRLPRSFLPVLIGVVVLVVPMATQAAGFPEPADIPTTIYLHGPTGDGGGLFLRPWRSTQSWDLAGSALLPPGCGEPTWAFYVGADSPPGTGVGSLADHGHIAAPMTQYSTLGTGHLALTIERPAGSVVGMPQPFQIAVALQVGRTDARGNTFWSDQLVGAAQMPAGIGAENLNITLSSDGGDTITWPGIVRLAISAYIEGQPCASLQPSTGAPRLRIDAVHPANLNLLGGGMVDLHRTTVTPRSASLEMAAFWGPSQVDWNASKVLMDGPLGVASGHRLPRYADHSNEHPWFDGPFDFGFPDYADSPAGNYTLRLHLVDRLGHAIADSNATFPWPQDVPVTCYFGGICTAPHLTSAEVVPSVSPTALIGVLGVGLILRARSARKRGTA